MLAAAAFARHPTPVARSLNVLRFGRAAASLRLFYRMQTFLGKGPYDIVHGHFGPLGNLAVVLKKIGVVRGKIVTTFHGVAIFPASSLGIGSITTSSMEEIYFFLSAPRSGSD